MDGVPTYATIAKTILQYHYFKKDCLTSSLYCGIAYNKAAFEGPEAECGKIDSFGIWKNNVDEKKAKGFVGVFREYYEFPIFNSPEGLGKDLNTFYQSKYGMFTCHDLNHCHGAVRYENELIQYWDRKLHDRDYTWYLAIAYSIQNNT